MKVDINAFFPNNPEFWDEEVGIEVIPRLQKLLTKSYEAENKSYDFTRITAASFTETQKRQISNLVTRILCRSTCTGNKRALDRLLESYLVSNSEVVTNIHELILSLPEEQRDSNTVERIISLLKILPQAEALCALRLIPLELRNIETINALMVLLNDPDPSYILKELEKIREEDRADFLGLIAPHLKNKDAKIKIPLIRGVYALPKEDWSSKMVKLLIPFAYVFAYSYDLLSTLNEIESSERSDVICKATPLIELIGVTHYRLAVLRDLAKIPKQERATAIALVSTFYEHIWTLSYDKYICKCVGRDGELSTTLSNLASLLPLFPRENRHQAEEVLVTIMELLKAHAPDLKWILLEVPAEERREFGAQILPLVRELSQGRRFYSKLSQIEDPNNLIFAIAQLPKAKRNESIRDVIGVMKQSKNCYVRDLMDVLVDTSLEKKFEVIAHAIPLLKIMRDGYHKLERMFSVLSYKDYPLLTRFLQENPSLELKDVITQFFSEFPEVKDRSYAFMSKNLKTVLVDSFFQTKASRLSNFLLEWQEQLLLEDKDPLIQRAKRICAMTDPSIENAYKALHSLQLEILSSKLQRVVFEEEITSDQMQPLGEETAKSFHCGVEAKVVPGTPSLIEEIFESIREYDDQKCLELLQNNPQVDVNLVDGEGYTLLHRLSQGGFETDRLISLLIERGADVHKRTPKGETALHIAARDMMCSDSSVSMLLENGADSHATDQNGDTPLHIAMKDGSPEFVHALLPKYRSAPQGFAHRNRKGERVFDVDVGVHFFYLIGKMTVDELSFAIDHGAKVNYILGSEWSTLDQAILCGSSEKLRLLIERGAEVNPDTKRSPLDLALDLSIFEMLSILYQKGAKFRKVRCFDENYLTPLMRMRFFLNPDKIHDYEGVLTLLQEADGGFTEKYLKLKLLAHRFGFNMSGIVLDGESIPELEGFKYIITKQTLLDSVKKVYEKGGSFSAQTYQDISGAIDRGSRDPEELYSSYEKGEIVFIPLVLDGKREASHFASVILWNNYLIKCNRGMGSERDFMGITRYGINIKQIGGTVTPEIIRKLQSRDKEYFTTSVNEDLLLSSVCGGGQKVQKAGTCSWASFKSSLYALLFVSHMREGKKQQEALELAKEDYKAWSFEDRELFLNELLEDLEKEPNEAFVQPLIYVLEKMARKEHILHLFSSRTRYGWRNPLTVELLLRMVLRNIPFDQKKPPKCSNETVERLISYIVRFWDEKQQSLLTKITC